MSKVPHGFRTFGQFVWRLTVNVTKHDIASLAAVISFYAFFSLFPLLVLIIYAASVFAPHTPVEYLLLHTVRAYFPQLSETQAFIQNNLERLSAAGAKVGLISGLILTWSATSGFIAIQQAMDIIWELKDQRSFVVRRLISFLMLVILLLFAILSAAGMVAYPAVVQHVLADFGFLHWFAWVRNISRVLFPCSLFFGCVVFYRFLPSKPTPWTYVLPGALVATAALDAGRELFVWYASHLVTYPMLYGTLTTVMLVILWMYIASILMLFGAEVAAAAQQMTEIPNLEEEPMD